MTESSLAAHCSVRALQWARAAIYGSSSPPGFSRGALIFVEITRALLRRGSLSGRVLLGGEPEFALVVSRAVPPRLKWPVYLLRRQYDGCRVARNPSRIDEP